MPGMLEQYMRTYGPRLQSALRPAMSPTPMSPVPPTPIGASSALESPALPGPGLMRPESPSPVSALMESEQPAEGQGTSFKDLWQQMPREAQKEQTNKLEDVLKRGGQTIDSAFDEMIAQLGSRPSGKLTREDKGMLLLEFGLALMANSSRNAFGKDFGGALGAAGVQTIPRLYQLTRGRQADYDQRVQAINAERAKAKSRLAEAVAKGEVQATSALAKAQQDASRIAGTVTTESGDVYGYTRGGTASALRDEQGRPIRARKPSSASEPLVQVQLEDGSVVWMPRSQAAGKSPPPSASALDKPFQIKASDSNTIWRQAAGLFGGTYDPFTGRIAGLNREQTLQVQDIAARATEIFIQQEPTQRNHAQAVKQAARELQQDGSATPAPGSTAADSDLPRPKTREEYEALDSDELFIAPDGSVRRKP